MIRTACVIGAFAFFAAQGARAGDTALAATRAAQLRLIGSFFLGTACDRAEQLCGRSVGARDRSAFVQATRLALGWGLGFGIACTMIFLRRGGLIELYDHHARCGALRMTSSCSPPWRPCLALSPNTYDGVFIARPGRATCATSCS